MEAFIVKMCQEVEINDNWNAWHYCTGLEAVHEAFFSMWDTFSQHGLKAAARSQSDFENEAATWAAFGLCTALLLEGYVGRPACDAWLRASFLYQQLTGSQGRANNRPASGRRSGPTGGGKLIIPGINAPQDESLEELNAWRGRYGLAPVAG